MGPAKTHSSAHGKMLAGASGQMPQDLGGASARTRGLMGKMETESWPASKPQDTTTNPLHFQRLVFCGGSELRMHNYKNEMFQTSSTPTAFFLLFTVLGGRIYFVSQCPFARKEKQVWPAENLIVFIPSLTLLRRWRKRSERSGGRAASPCAGLRVISTLQGEHSSGDESRSRGGERGPRLNRGKWEARAGLNPGPRALGASSESLTRERKASVWRWPLSPSPAAQPRLCSHFNQ